MHAAVGSAAVGDVVDDPAAGVATERYTVDRFVRCLQLSVAINDFGRTVGTAFFNLASEQSIGRCTFGIAGEEVAVDQRWCVVIALCQARFLGNLYILEQIK